MMIREYKRVCMYIYESVQLIEIEFDMRIRAGDEIELLIVVLDEVNE